MQQPFTSHHRTDRGGYPAGGEAAATGINVMFQDGPLQKEEEPNGAFVETLIAITVDRLEWYQRVQDGRYRCRENSLAITHLQEALHWLNHRTADRVARGVEGTHKP